MPIRDNPGDGADTGDLASRVAALETERNFLRDRCRTLETLIEQHDLLLLPPASLRVRVGGWEDPDHFLAVGRKIYWDVKRLLGRVGRSLPEFGSILDFGCGCGRLTRYLRATQAQRVCACDIDAESIEWCKENLAGTGVEFSHTGIKPPLPFESGAFEIVLAVSVFTHLPEAMQFEWLDELARVMRPGGLLIASTHGEALLPCDVPDAIRGELRASGFLYAKGGGTPGLPDFYQTAYHRRDYVAARWQRGFDLVHSLPRGINNHQDAYILSRRAPGAGV